jgi:hypothetical protein
LRATWVLVEPNQAGGSAVVIYWVRAKQSVSVEM